MRISSFSNLRKAAKFPKETNKWLNDRHWTYRVLCFIYVPTLFLSLLSFRFVKGTPGGGWIQLWDFDSNRWNTIVRFVFAGKKKKKKTKKWTRRRRYTHPPALRCNLTYRCTVLPTTASTAVVRGDDYRRRVRQIPRPRRATRVVTARKTAMNRGWNQWAKWNGSNLKRFSGVWSRRWATKLRVLFSKNAPRSNENLSFILTKFVRKLSRELSLCFIYSFGSNCSHYSQSSSRAFELYEQICFESSKQVTLFSIEILKTLALACFIFELRRVPPEYICCKIETKL